MPVLIKLLTELSPLFAFFASYKYYGMMIATAVITVLTVVTSIVTYYYHKKIPMVNLVITLLILILGSITIMTGNSTFIKIKPTIINLVFATALLGGLYFNKLFLKQAFGSNISLSDQDWIIFSKRWAYFFLFLAVFNEIIWRNFSDDLWVKFKVFGILIFTGIFLACNTRFLAQAPIKESEPKDPTES